MFKVNKFYLLSFISLLILNVKEGQASAGYEEEKISSGPAAAPPSVTRTGFLPQETSPFVRKIFNQDVEDSFVVPKPNHTYTQLASLIPITPLRAIIDEYAFESLLCCKGNYKPCFPPMRPRFFIINLKTYEIDDIIEVGTHNFDYYSSSFLVKGPLFAFSKSKNPIYIADGIGGRKIGESIKVEDHPYYYTLIGNYLFVTKLKENSVTVIDTETMKKIGEDIRVGKLPRSATLIEEGLAVNCGEGVYVIDHKAYLDHVTARSQSAVAASSSSSPGTKNFTVLEAVRQLFQTFPSSTSKTARLFLEGIFK